MHTANRPAPITNGDHQSNVPAAVLRTYPAHTVHPTIVEVFTPGKGWKRFPATRKLVSVSACRKLRRAGATHIGLGLEGQAPGTGGRVADFAATELCR